MADAPQPRRTLSRESCVQPRETESAFAAFLSDGSSDEDEDDADSRALLRMQQQADDSAYSETPFKLEASVSTDVVDLMTLVERVTVLSDAVDPDTGPTTCSIEDEPKRKTSGRETESAFADFLSDGSSDEDEDDADARAVLRMQQQEDDRLYVDTSLKMDRPTTNSSFRLTLAKPDLDDDMGPRKLVEAMKRGSAVVEMEMSVEEDRPSFNDVHSFTGPEISFVEDTVDHSASRPPSFEEGDSFFDEPRPSFSDEHSFTGGDSFTDNSFVYRPSLPDEEETQNKLETSTTSFVDASFVYRPSLPDNVNKQLPDQVQSTSDINDNRFVYRPTLPSETQKIDTESNAVAVATESSLVYRSTLPDNETGNEVNDDTKRASSSTSAPVENNSVVYRPSLPDDTPEIVFGYTRPASTNTSTSEENNFVYRPTLPDDKPQGGIQENNSARGSSDTAVQVKNVQRTSGEESHGDEDEPSFLSPSASRFIRSSDAVALKFGDMDSSFRLHEGETAFVAVDDSFSSVLTDSCASVAPPTLDTMQAPNVDKPTADIPVSISHAEEKQMKLTATPVASDNDGNAAQDGDAGVHALKAETSPNLAICIKPPLSRHSSVASSTGSSRDLSSQQRRMTATRESWRVSSLDFRESKHAFDEELAPLAGHLSPRASSVENEQQRHRLSSTFEERSSVASATSNSSSVTSFHSQADFFVDDIQQSFSSASSLSLDSRASGDDSFANVAILGDDVRDQNERRSSDIISQDVGELRSSNISKNLDHSYSDLVDTTARLDQSFSNLVNRKGFYPTDGDRTSANISANGTSLGSSLAASAVSQSSVATDELPFVSFNASSGSALQPKAEDEKHSSPTISLARQKLASESQQVFYRSIVLPPSSDVKTTKSSMASSAYSTSTTSFSSAALLAAIKTRDVRTNTRSEETEAGDVALGALPRLAPPLKINLVTRGRGSLSSSLLSKSGAGSSPSISPSPLALSTRSSVASSTGTADRLDFTGVYRGSVNSLEASRTNGVALTEGEATQEKPKQKLRDERMDAIKLELLGVKLERSVSDSRTMQREAQRKVEEFFQRAYEKSVDDIDEREVHHWPTRKNRARTMVHHVQEEPSHFAFGDNKVPKIIDLRNLRNGGKQNGWHLEDDAPLTPQRDENSSKQGAMAMTIGTSSTGTTATRSMPSDHIPMPPNYVISPQAADAVKPKVLQKKKNREATATGSAVSSGLGGDGINRFGAAAGRRADNVSLTPTLPRLSANDSPAFSPSPFVTSLATPNGFGGSGGIGRSPGKSPVAFAATASGFMWKAGSDFDGMKRSNVDAQFGASHVSFSQRSTLAGRVQSLSASLASTLRRILHGKNTERYDANHGVTSPQSQCTAPAALPRAYDQNGFYEAPFKVPGLNKPLEQRRKKNVESDCAWTRQWLILVTCAMVGLSLGAILVCVVAFNSTVFNLSADEVHERQESNGELIFAAGVQWILLPGHLFLRVWSAVTTLLLFCYVATSVADLVGCADKSALVLSIRSIGYTLLLAILATLEGVLAMWMTHNFGWFRGHSDTSRAKASTLSDAIGVTPLPSGVVGLVCSADGEYLQRLEHNVFACSNASLTLPLYEEVSTNSTGITDSGPAVFVLQEVTDMLAAPTSVPYYPASLGSGWNMTTSVLSRLTPDNVALQFTQVELDEVASLGGLIVFGLLLGYVCGKRILSLRRDTQAAMFETVGSSAPDPYKSRHYIIGILMELQLALEWLVRPMERYLAPLGFFSLMLGNVVRHHREWHSFTSPMTSLIVGVLLVLILHAALVLPIVLRLLSSSRRLPLLTTTRAFAPAFLFAFTTDNIALSAPISMQCYTRVNTVTRSSAQLATAITAALTRNARALYLPLLLLWLLETSATEELVLSTLDYISVGLLSLMSSFCGGNTRLTLAMARTLWSIAVIDESASLLPSTMPLLVVCDMVLSRVGSVVNMEDHLVLTHLVVEHWDETVVQGATSDNINNVSSPSPLNDSQVPRPSSSAMLSSVYL